MDKFIILLLSVALSGCASGISKSTNFDTSNENGLVVFSMVSHFGHLDSISFIQLDPKTCQVIGSTVFNGRNYYFGLTKKNFLMDSFEPGIWIVRQVELLLGNTRTRIKFKNGAVAFRVNSGEFIHVGKLNFSKYGSSITTPDQGKLNQFLAGYSNINSELKPAKMRTTPYSTKEEEKIIGCNPNI